MTEHNIKLTQPYFSDVVDGSKKFEYRFNDRDYQVGDIVKLWEWTGEEYTGFYITVTIDYILEGGQFSIPEGYCIFSIK